MARGWESKSVEEQQAESAASQSPATPRLSPEQASRERQKQGLRLSRQRVLDQLQNVQNPRHQQLLQDTLADLDAKLAGLS